MGLKSTLRGGLYAVGVGTLASVGVWSGVRRACKELDAFRQGVEAMIEQSKKESPGSNSAVVMELMLLSVEVGHAVGHYVRALDDDEILEDVMAEFHAIMSRSPLRSAEDPEAQG